MIQARTTTLDQNGEPVQIRVANPIVPRRARVREERPRAGPSIGSA